MGAKPVSGLNQYSTGLKQDGRQSQCQSGDGTAGTLLENLSPHSIIHNIHNTTAQKQAIWPSSSMLYFCSTQASFPQIIRHRFLFLTLRLPSFAFLIISLLSITYLRPSDSRNICLHGLIINDSTAQLNFCLWMVQGVT